MSLLILFSVVMSIVGIAIMHKRHSIFRLRQPNVLQVMFLSHLLAQLIPAVIIALDPYNRNGPVFLFYCSLATVLIPVGGIIADWFVTPRPRAAFYRQPLSGDPQTLAHFKVFFHVYFLLCLAIFGAYVVQVPTIPVYDLLFGTGDILGLQHARREAVTQGRIFGMAVRAFMPILFILGLVALRYLPKGSLTRILAPAAMILALLYNAWPGNKTPVATLFVMAVFVLLIRSSEEIPGLSARQRAAADKRRKRLVWIAIIMALFAIAYPIVVFYQLPAGKLGFGYVMESVFTRIFFKPAENTYAAFELFRYGGYTYFADIDAIAALFGWQFVELSKEIAIYRGLGGFTNAPPAAIGNFYAQGGGIVVVAGVVFAAMLFRLTEHVLRRQRAKTPLSLAFYAILIFSAFRFSWGNFHTMLLSETFLPMAFVALVWFLAGGAVRQHHWQAVPTNR